MVKVEKYNAVSNPPAVGDEFHIGNKLCVISTNQSGNLVALRKLDSEQVMASAPSLESFIENLQFFVEYESAALVRNTPFVEEFSERLTNLLTV